MQSLIEQSFHFAGWEHIARKNIRALKFGATPRISQQLLSTLVSHRFMLNKNESQAQMHISNVRAYANENSRLPSCRYIDADGVALGDKWRSIKRRAATGNYPADLIDEVSALISAYE
jgi:hypothetical protein